MAESLRARWLAFVPRRPAGACWIWTGAVDRDGYGVISIGRQTVGAHRVSFELWRRPLPPGSLVQHTCDVPACVNPAHLEVGTKRTNALDMTRKGRRASVLSAGKVAEIKSRPRSQSTSSLAAEFGVSASTIRAIRSGKAWADVEPKK